MGDIEGEWEYRGYPWFWPIRHQRNQAMAESLECEEEMAEEAEEGEAEAEQADLCGPMHARKQ